MIKISIVIIFAILLLNLPMTLGDVAYEEKFKNKLQKIKTEVSKKDTKKDKKSPDRSDQVAYQEFSKKISKSLIKAVKEFPKKSFPNIGVDSDGRTPVYVYLDDEESIKKLSTKITVIGSAGKIAVGKLSLEEMNNISENDYVLFVGPVHRPVFYPSQAVSISGASVLHLAGYDGTGVRVAVIDDSFFLTDPSIAPNVFFGKLFDSPGFCGGSISCGMAPGDSHGTAVAEIIVDMAPDVELLLYAITTSVDFEHAVDDAILNGADIITASLGFVGMGGDGTTGAFKDGTSIVAKKVNEANSAGVLFTVAAGNGGQSHWMGNYVPSSVSPSSLGLPSGYDHVMEFNPAATGKLKACLPVTDYGSLYVLSWNEWTTSFNDYDFFLYGPTMAAPPLEWSDDDQTIGGAPVEGFFGVVAGPACLVIASWQSTGSPFFHIDALDNLLSPAFNMRDGSISTPADASGAFSVGAVYYSSLTLEPFSSSGPTDDGRKKPEICGYDGTSSSQALLNPFFGTSASTPHVAGAAAVLLEENPSLTVTELKSKLQSMAIFDPAFSVDNLCDSSSGRLYITDSTCGLSFSSGSLDHGNIKTGETGDEISLILTNPGSVSSTVRISGTPWINTDTSATIMPESNTHYSLGTSPSGVSFDDKTPLTSSPTFLAFVPASGSLEMVFQLRAALSTVIYGPTLQEVFFEASC